MDILVRQRAPVRANFTKFCQSLKTVFKSSITLENVEVKFSSMKRTFCNLTVLYNEILELLLNDDLKTKYADEYEIIESYR